MFLYPCMVTTSKQKDTRTTCTYKTYRSKRQGYVVSGLKTTVPAQAQAKRGNGQSTAEREKNKTKQLQEPIVAVVSHLLDVPVGRPAPPPPMKLQSSGS